MLLQRLTRPANKVLVLTCLLAATTFLAGSWQARAQATSDARIIGTPSSPESMIRLGGHTPRKVKDGTAIRVGHYEPQNKLRLAIFVTPRDLAGQEKLLTELQDKKSPMFHKWLTAAEWNARFGPRVEDEQAVVDWAKSQGLTITNRFDNRMIVDVEAESGTIEKALGVAINKYQVGDEVDFSNDSDPLIPARLSGVIGGVFGLTSIERMKAAGNLDKNVKFPDYTPGPVYSEGKGGKGEGDPSKAPWAQHNGIGETGSGPHAEMQSPSSGNSPNPPNELGTMSPSNLYSSNGYSLGALNPLSKCCNVHNDSTGSPADTSIALVTYGAPSYDDATVFFQYYGLAWNITQLQIDGNDPNGNNTPSECTVGATGCPGDGLSGEANLDLEWSTAFANSFGSPNDTAHVYVYEGNGGFFNTLFDEWNYVLSDAHAHVVSTSWYWVEEGQQAGDPGWMTGTVNGDAHYVFNALVAQGNTLLAASGDQGPTAGCTNADQLYWPATDPDFLSAGGTSLTLNYDGSFASETAWVGGSTLANCQSNGGGGGGGISEYFSAPSWQSGITYEEMDNGNDYIVSNQPNRMEPDMSLNSTGSFQWYYCTTPCNNTASNGWGGVGGTSIVDPELAGFYAQVNSYLNSIGHICGTDGTSACEPIGNPDPILYEEGMGQGAPHYPFYDTTQGCVTNYLTAQNPDLLYFCATPGYDLATGWGSANLLQLAWAYNFYIIPADGVPSVAFSGPAKNTWFNSDQEISWTVSDGVTSSTAGLPAPGVAGFTQGWDSIPADPYSEPHGGSGNSFYSGPQYPGGKSGCLSFDGAGGCSSLASPQGCHTVNVEAWDNQGFTTGATTYGPVCYDTVAPTMTASTNPSTSYTTYVDKSVVVTLIPTDPGGSAASGIKATYYSINSEECSPGTISDCNVYSGPFTISGTQQSYVWFFTEDKAGNFSSQAYIYVSIDETLPVTTATPSGDLQSGTYYSKVGISLSAVENGGSGVANTYYILDSNAQTTYSGSFSVSSIGSHTLKYWSVSGAGEVESQHTLSFTIAPDTATTLASPAAGSTFTGPSVTFNWNAAAGANGYFLHLGSTGVGSDNILNSTEYSSGTVLANINNLPLNGETIYARMFTDYGGNHVYKDYTFKAASQATITSPTPTTTIPDPTVTFSWAAATGSINGYFLHVGTTGVGSDNLLNSAEYSTSTTSVTLTNIPAAGGSIYVRLFTDYGGVHEYEDYVYYAPTAAIMSSPLPTTTLAGPSATFTWASAVGGFNGYFLHVGTTGVGSYDVLNSSEYTNGTGSVTVNGLPTTGGQIYVRLFTDFYGTHVYRDYVYTAAQQASLTAPEQGATVTGSSATFSWSAATGTVSGYFLHIGTTGVGSLNVLNSIEYNPATTSVTVNNLPTTGGTLYVRVFTDYGGVHVYRDYTLTEAN